MVQCSELPRHDLTRVWYNEVMRQGADPDELDQLAARFRGGADRIDGHLDELQRLSRQAMWHGADAHEFGILLQGELRTRLNHGAARMRDAAVQLRRQAEQQREASAAGGGGDPAGGSNGRRGGPRGPLDFGPFARFLDGLPWPASALGPVLGLATAAQLAQSLALLLPGSLLLGAPIIGGTAAAYAIGLLWPHGEATVTPWVGDPLKSPGAFYHRRADSIGNYLDEMRDLHEGEIEIRHIDGSDPPRYVVLLKGIDGFVQPDSHDSVTDLNAALIERMQKDGRWSRAVERAMDQADIPADAQVMLVGHSGGGIVAANLAGNEEFLSKYHVTHVLTNGSGVTDKLSSAAGDVKVLMLDHNTDVVARTIQTPFPPGHGDGTTHIAHSFEDTTPRGGSEDLGSGHHYDYYSNEIDTTRDPAVRAWLDSAGAYRGSGSPQFFRMSD